MEQLEYEPSEPDMQSGNLGESGGENERLEGRVNEGHVQRVKNPVAGVEADGLSEEGRIWTERREAIDSMVRQIDWALEVLNDAKFIPPAVGFIREKGSQMGRLLSELGSWYAQLRFRLKNGQVSVNNVLEELQHYAVQLGRLLTDTEIDAGWLRSKRRAAVRELDLEPVDSLFKGFDNWSLPGIDAADRETSTDREFMNLVRDIQEQMQRLAQDYRNIFPDGMAGTLNEGLRALAHGALAGIADLEDFKGRINKAVQDLANNPYGPGDALDRRLFLEELPGLIAKLSGLYKPAKGIDEELYQKFSRANVESWLENLENLKRELLKARELAAQQEEQIAQQFKSLKETEQPQKAEGNKSTPAAHRVSKATHGHDRETPSSQ